MELIEAIKSRRSIRKFKEESLPSETIKELIETAVWCPSATNLQPWGFVVINDREYLKELSDLAKADWLIKLKGIEGKEQYKAMMENPDFNIFYNAPTLLNIYGLKESKWSINDCSMLAQNLMLLAWEKGIGSCWIGFAQNICNSKEFKVKHNVRDDYDLVAAIILGYPQSMPKGVVPRKEYPIFSWDKK